MIPPDKCVAVERALGEAFGVKAFEDIQPLTSSAHSDPVFRIVVRGSPFVLRIITRTSDPGRYIACMNAAAAASLAPRVLYASVEDRICITGFVKAAPFLLAEALVRMPAALRALHALAPFPGVPNHINTSCMFLLNGGPAVDGFLRKFQEANLVPKEECDEVFACYELLAAVYPRDESDMVSSHNDLKPDNILFDGSSVRLLDWEAAFLNDRYSDLAAVAHFIVTNEAEEKTYLQEYFGQAPDERQLSRFFLLRQVSHLFYAMAYLLMTPAGDLINHGESALEFKEFYRRLWVGELKLADHRVRRSYGRVHWAQVVQNLRQSRFSEAMRIVAGRHGHE